LKAGRLAEFDSLANKFFVASGKTRDSIYKEALTLAKEAGAASKHYVHVMGKLVNGTESYLEKESKRYVKRHFITHVWATFDTHPHDDDVA